MKKIVNWVFLVALLCIQNTICSTLCIDFGNSKICGTNSGMFGQPCGVGCTGCETCSEAATCEANINPWTKGHCVSSSEDSR